MCWRISKKSVVFILMISVVLVFGCDKKTRIETKQEKKAIDSGQANSKLNGTITGASMVPMLMGEHYASQCSRCDFEMRFEIMEKNGVFVCENCGTANRLADCDVKKVPGDQRLFDKYPLDRTLKHWDIVAFKSSTGTESDYKVKRMVGLPGEIIELHDGDLYVNGKRPIKPKHVLEKMKVLVHDSNSPSKSDPRWLQNKQPTLFPFELNRKITSMHYQHLACYRNRDQRRKELIKDSYGFNQTLSRALNTVGDFGVEVTLSNAADLRIELQMNSPKYGRVQFDFEQIDDDAELDGCVVWQYLKDQGKTKLFSGFRSTMPKTVVLQFWLLDGQARLFVDGFEFGVCSLFETNPPSTGQSADARFAFEVDSSLELTPSNQIAFTKLSAKTGEIQRMRIFRDLHYYDRLPGRQQTLGDDEYFVLGDNVPVSNDSRQFGGIERAAVVGVLPQNKR